MTFRAAVAVIAAMALFSGCSGDAPAPKPVPTATVDPGEQWDTIDPDGAGFERSGLRKLDRLLAGNRSNCEVVTRDGKLVHEKYWRGSKADTKKPVFSVTKSFTSVLVGIAQDQGKLSLDDKASKYIPEWIGTPSEDVTIRNLLSNDSGRHWDFETDYIGMAARAVDKTAFAVGLKQDAEPGNVWHYNNSAIQTLAAVLRAATGQEPAAYAATHLFGPLGMSNTTWIPDRSLHTSTYAGISSTCLDLARFGLMTMRGGEWNGKRIVSETYLGEATGKSSTELNAAYGLLWWVNRSGTVLGALTATGSTNDENAYVGQLAPRAPDDAYWALGFGKQIISVVPSKGVVAVRMGTMPTDQTVISPNSFTGAVLDALK
ncbi:serine hydrolase domain-containing protein [Aeromicrobium sp.]|uniref:serine hydrolase domain-containing protein n=1 Tax=Aeromicrobium sp. TaxID=1871063 RepID=UPI002FCB1216